MAVTTEPEPAVSTYAFEQLHSDGVSRRADVDDVLSAAAYEAEAIRDRARAAGEAEGRARGLEAFRSEAEAGLTALHQAAAGVQSLVGELLDQLEHDAVELALRLAEQIIQGQVAADPSLVVGVARTALRRVADRRRITLIVNPADLELVGEAAPGLTQELGGIEQLDLHADRRIGRGGAIARTEFGEIDATIEAQLETVREIVRAAAGGETSPVADDA